MKSDKETKQGAKERIFNTAISLFAQKGFNAIGIREIAKKAEVNISMINYYFGGKVGILEAIVNEHRRKYYDAVQHIGDDTMSVRERAHILVGNVVSFYRNNLELALVGTEAVMTEIPEIADLQNKWVMDNRTSTDKWFKLLGFDLTNPVQMTVIRFVLTAIIHTHFEQNYVWQRVLKAPKKPKFVEEYLAQGEDKCCEISDDVFYKNYADMLAEFYFNGIQGIIGENKKGG